MEDIARSNDHILSVKKEGLYHIVLRNQTSPVYKTIYQKLESKGLKVEGGTNIAELMVQPRIARFTDLNMRQFTARMHYSTPTGTCFMPLY